MKNIYKTTITEKLNLEKLVEDKSRRDQAEKLLTTILEKKLIANLYGTEMNKLSIDESIIHFENLLNVRGMLNEAQQNEFHARLLQLIEQETSVPEDEETEYGLSDLLDDSLQLLDLQDDDLEKDFTTKFYKLFADFSLLDAPEDAENDDEDKANESINESSFLELFNAPQVHGIMNNSKVKGLGEWIVKGVSNNRLTLAEIVLVIQFLMFVRQKYRDFQAMKNRLEASNDFKESTDLHPHKKPVEDPTPQWMK